MFPILILLIIAFSLLFSRFLLSVVLDGQMGATPALVPAAAAPVMRRRMMTTTNTVIADLDKEVEAPVTAVKSVVRSSVQVVSAVVNAHRETDGSCPILVYRKNYVH